jgi:hypothetical protein
MKKILFILLGVFSTSVFAVQGSGGQEQIETLQATKDYCIATGGDVVKLTAQFDTHDGLVNGVTKEFCRYDNHENSAVVGLETLSKTSTIAATYTKKLKLDKTRLLPTKPYANPSLNVCQLLHGSEIAFAAMDGGFSDDKGQLDICVFGDGSSISAWTMIYAAQGSRKDISRFIRSKPLAIDIPNIQS